MNVHTQMTAFLRWSCVLLAIN